MLDHAVKSRYKFSSAEIVWTFFHDNGDDQMVVAHWRKKLILRGILVNHWTDGFEVLCWAYRITIHSKWLQKSVYIHKSTQKGCTARHLKHRFEGLMSDWQDFEVFLYFLNSTQQDVLYCNLPTFVMMVNLVNCLCYLSFLSC